ncbi:hypothetical protein PUN28_012210 [Cardiocondyla obscurior]|uniref:Uncharacterized protein n=1 Tax=Cardiocondyla obscurior TaxID=286306 RepID=A0AAW2FA02_9HYME
MAFSQSHRQDLLELAEITGIFMTPDVFRIVLELLALQVSPEGVYTLLKQISAKSSKYVSRQTTNENAHTSDSSTKK